MKSKIKISTAIMVAFAASLLLSNVGFSQSKKLPKGTVVYKDGSNRLPDGTVIRRDGTIRKTGGHRLPEGTVILPGKNKDIDSENRNGRRKYGKTLPPGQAKKRYGGSAKDYAPGQQKKHRPNGRPVKRNGRISTSQQRG